MLGTSLIHELMNEKKNCWKLFWLIVYSLEYHISLAIYDIITNLTKLFTNSYNIAPIVQWVGSILFERSNELSFIG